MRELVVEATVNIQEKIPWKITTSTLLRRSIPTSTEMFINKTIKCQQITTATRTTKAAAWKRTCQFHHSTCSLETGSMINSNNDKIGEAITQASIII